MVDAHRRRDPARRWPRRRSTPTEVVAVSVHRPVGSTVPVDDRRHARSATASSGWTAAARRHVARGRRRAGGGLRARGRCGAGCAAPAARRRPAGADPIGHMLYLAARRAGGRGARTRGSSSRSTTCRCASPASPPRRHASMTARVAHRQPRPRRARATTPSCVRRAGVDAAQAAAAAADRHRSSAPCAPTWPPTLGLPDGRRRWSPARPTCTRRRSAPARVLDYETHLAHQHDVVDQLPGAVQEDRRAPPDRDASRASRPTATWSRTTTRPAALCLQWLRDNVLAARPATAVPLRRAHRRCAADVAAGRRRRASSRRG